MNEAWQTIAKYVIDPWAAARWADWRGFWLQQVFDDRLLVIFCLPIVPILLLLPQRYLRAGIVATGLLFCAFVFGAFHSATWLLTVTAFFYLGQVFHREARRTDVLPWGPPLAAVAILVGWYYATMAVKYVGLPGGLDAWVRDHAPWMLPYGMRGFAWEPDFRHAFNSQVTLFAGAFFSPHNIGTAYLFWKLIHYFSELKRDTIPLARRTLGNFLAWTCYAPSLMQGPLERFGTFQDEMDTCRARRSWAALGPALWRMSLGFAKVLVATVVFSPILWHDLGIQSDRRTYYDNPQEMGTFWLFFGVFFQIFWLYLEFAGYCDISAGIARLLGYRQIENFAMPWFATSLRDFWRRWHISLSSILRDYLYIPLGGNRRHVTLNLCITFGLCGLWHAPIPKVGIWGILMGLMLALNQRWVDWMQRLDAAGAPRSHSGHADAKTVGMASKPPTWAAAVRRAWLHCRPLPQLCAWLLTQHAFVFSLLIFFGGVGGLRVLAELARRAWAAISGS